MLVSLQSDMQHLSRLVTLLVDQLVANGQEPGEARGHNLVELRPVRTVARLEPVRAADGQETLKSCQDRARIVDVEQSDGEVHKARPLIGEVEVEDALKDGNELLANQGLGAREDGEQPLSKSGFLIFGYDSLVGVLV